MNLLAANDSRTLAVFLVGAFGLALLWLLVDNPRRRRGRATMRVARRRFKRHHANQRRIEAKVVTLIESGLADEAVDAFATAGLPGPARLLETALIGADEQHGLRLAPASRLRQLASGGWRLGPRPLRLGPGSPQDGRARHGSPRPLPPAMIRWVEPAAEAFSRRRRPVVAARLCRLAGLESAALRHFAASAKLLDPASARGSLTDDDRKMVIDHVAQGVSDPELDRLVVLFGSHVALFKRLARAGRAEHAARLYRLAGNPGDEVLAAAGQDPDVLRAVAVTLVQAGDPARAGMLFERAGAFGEAAAAFVKAGDADRAHYCRSREEQLGRAAGGAPPPHLRRSLIERLFSLKSLDSTVSRWRNKKP